MPIINLDSKEKATLFVIFLGVFVLFISVGLIIGKLRKKRRKKKKDYINEHTSNTGIITKKECCVFDDDYYFYVYAEHQYKPTNGESKSVVYDYHVEPYLFEQICVGCIITTDNEKENIVSYEKPSVLINDSSIDNKEHLPTDLSNITKEQGYTEANNKTCGYSQETFFELFEKTESIEDVIRLVSDFVKKYETRTDDFWRQSETALLTALCVYVHMFNQSRRKEALEEYLNVLSRSDRKIRNSWIDKRFAAWKETWPNDEGVIAYDIFLQAEPIAQFHIIKGCECLFIKEMVET